MPLSNNASYVPTMDAFKAHWTLVNAALTPDLIVSLKKSGAMTLVDFTALRELLLTQNPSGDRQAQ